MDQIHIITPLDTIPADIKLAPDQPPWPAPEVLIKAAQTALLTPHQDASLSICIVDIARMQQLNLDFRQQDKPTNVLAFPNQSTAGERHHWPEDCDDKQQTRMAVPTRADQDYLGDVAICYPIVHSEALAQHISLQSHWAHLTVHAVLHLQGFEHDSAADARIMEDLESKLMQQMGYASPYT